MIFSHIIKKVHRQVFNTQCRKFSTLSKNQNLGLFTLFLPFINSIYFFFDEKILISKAFHQNPIQLSSNICSKNCSGDVLIILSHLNTRQDVSQYILLLTMNL